MTSRQQNATSGQRRNQRLTTLDHSTASLLDSSRSFASTSNGDPGKSTVLDDSTNAAEPSVASPSRGGNKSWLMAKTRLKSPKSPTGVTGDASGQERGHWALLNKLISGKSKVSQSRTSSTATLNEQSSDATSDSSSKKTIHRSSSFNKLRRLFSKKEESATSHDETFNKEAARELRFRTEDHGFGVHATRANYQRKYVPKTLVRSPSLQEKKGTSRSERNASIIDISSNSNTGNNDVMSRDTSTETLTSPPVTQETSLQNTKYDATRDYNTAAASDCVRVTEDTHNKAKNMRSMRARVTSSGRPQSLAVNNNTDGHSTRNGKCPKDSDGDRETLPKVAMSSGISQTLGRPECTAGSVVSDASATPMSGLPLSNTTTETPSKCSDFTDHRNNVNLGGDKILKPTQVDKGDFVRHVVWYQGRFIIIDKPKPKSQRQQLLSKETTAPEVPICRQDTKTNAAKNENAAIGKESASNRKKRVSYKVPHHSGNKISDIAKKHMENYNMRQKNIAALQDSKNKTKDDEVPRVDVSLGHSVDRGQEEPRETTRSRQTSTSSSREGEGRPSKRYRRDQTRDQTSDGPDSHMRKHDRRALSEIKLEDRNIEDTTTSSRNTLQSQVSIGQFDLFMYSDEDSELAGDSIHDGHNLDSHFYDNTPGSTSDTYRGHHCDYRNGRDHDLISSKEFTDVILEKEGYWVAQGSQDIYAKGALPLDESDSRRNVQRRRHQYPLHSQEEVLDEHDYSGRNNHQHFNDRDRYSLNDSQNPAREVGDVAPAKEENTLHTIKSSYETTPIRKMCDLEDIYEEEGENDVEEQQHPLDRLSSYSDVVTKSNYRGPNNEADSRSDAARRRRESFQSRGSYEYSLESPTDDMTPVSTVSTRNTTKDLHELDMQQHTYTYDRQHTRSSRSNNGFEHEQRDGHHTSWESQHSSHHHTHTHQPYHDTHRHYQPHHDYHNRNMYHQPHYDNHYDNRDYHSDHRPHNDRFQKHRHHYHDPPCSNLNTHDTNRHQKQLRFSEVTPYGQGRHSREVVAQSYQRQHPDYDNKRGTSICQSQEDDDYISHHDWSPMGLPSPVFPRQTSFSLSNNSNSESSDVNSPTEEAKEDISPMFNRQNNHNTSAGHLGIPDDVTPLIARDTYPRDTSHSDVEVGVAGSVVCLTSSKYFRAAVSSGHVHPGGNESRLNLNKAVICGLCGLCVMVMPFCLYFSLS